MSTIISFAFSTVPTFEKVLLKVIFDL